MSSQQIVSDVRDLLGNYPGLVLAYLFGSQAEDLAGPGSDYDFAVLASEVQDIPAFRAKLSHELGSILRTSKIDVVILNSAPVELAYSIIAQGKPIYQRDEATRVEFEAGVMGRYGDYLPILRAQRDDLYRGGEHAARVRRYREALGRTERQIGEIRASESKTSR